MQTCALFSNPEGLVFNPAQRLATWTLTGGTSSFRFATLALRVKTVAGFGGSTKGASALPGGIAGVAQIVAARRGGTGDPARYLPRAMVKTPCNGIMQDLCGVRINGLLGFI